MRFRWAPDEPTKSTLAARARKKSRRRGVDQGSAPSRGAAASAATGQRDVPSTRAATTSGAGGAARVLRHSFYVRPGALATFELPEDITSAEIERLCLLLRAVPFAAQHD